MSNHDNSNLPASCPALFQGRWVATGLDRQIAAVNLEHLCQEYRFVREHAPSRTQRGKNYFTGHNGIPSTGGYSNRREEHGAIALFNLQRDLQHPDGGSFRFLDYQFPLKARQSDRGIGKIDLVGVNDQGRLIVTELKLEGQGETRGDAPPLALMEGLRYAAIVEANLPAIASEAKRGFDVTLQQVPPVVQLLATAEWWRGWMRCSAAGNWQDPMAALIDGIQDELGIRVDCLALDSLEFNLGLNGTKPMLDAIPNLQIVSL